MKTITTCVIFKQNQPILDQIAEKLRQEIDSLEGSIQLTEETAILRHWIQSILEPLDRDGQHIPENELSQVIEILNQARQQYNLDGELGDRLDSLLSRYTNGTLEGTNSADDTVQDPDADPFDFLDDDDEEEADDGIDADDEQARDAGSSTSPDTDDVVGLQRTSPNHSSANGESDEDDEYDDFVAFDIDGDEKGENRIVDFGKDEEDGESANGLFDEESDRVDSPRSARNGSTDDSSAKDHSSRENDDDYDDYDDAENGLSGNRIVDFGKDETETNGTAGLLDAGDDIEISSPSDRDGTAGTQNDTTNGILSENESDDDDDYDSFIDFGQDDDGGGQPVDFGKDESDERSANSLFNGESDPNGAAEAGSSSSGSAANGQDSSPNGLFGTSEGAEKEDEEEDDYDDYDDYGEEASDQGDPNGLFANASDTSTSTGSPIDRDPVDHPERGNTIAERAAQSASGAQGRVPQRFSTEKDSKIRDGRSANSKNQQATVDICAARVGLKELLSNMDIQLPQQDLTQLNHALKNKFQSKPIVALQNNPSSEGQYVLIPRISRFFHKGQLYSCTVKNLARTYFSLFADIKDLTQYKGAPFLNTETPKLGWAIVTREALRESLDKDFMQQNQCMRQLATEANTPSHFVRRRSLPEAIYDLVVGRLVLDEAFLTQTIDWTTSGPSSSEFVCTYYSDEGIRLRHLPRTQHNRALGVCPNW